MGLGKSGTTGLSSTIVQFDCIGHGRGAAEQFSELSDRIAFSGTLIKNGKRLIDGRAQESRSVGNGFRGGGVEAPFHLGN